MYRITVVRHLAIALMVGCLRLSAAESTTPAPASPAPISKERFEVKGVVRCTSYDYGRNCKAAGLRIAAPDSPYAANAQSDPLTGEFKFKKVPEGTYILDAFGKAGSARYIIRLSKATAGESKTVLVNVTLQIRQGDLKNHLKRRFEVSYRTLSIPAKAYKEYEAAEKRIQKEDYPGAIERLEKAVEIAPQYTGAWYRLGIIAYYQKRFPDAERYFRSAVEGNPEAWDARVRLGQVLLMQEKAAEAVPVAAAGVKLRPNDPTSRGQLAMAYVALKEYEKAAEQLVEAKKLDPRHYTEPQLWLARIYVVQKKYTAAIHEVEEYVALHPRGRETEELRKWLREVKGGERRE